MSGDTPSEHPLIVGEFIDVRSQSSSFVHAISVVNRWFEIAAQHHDPTIATVTAVSTIASGHQTAAIAVVPLDQNLGPYADIKETAPARGRVPPLGPQVSSLRKAGNSEYV
jgi:hypothetical protein